MRYRSIQAVIPAAILTLSLVCHVAVQAARAADVEAPPLPPAAPLPALPGFPAAAVPAPAPPREPRVMVLRIASDGKVELKDALPEDVARTFAEAHQAQVAQAQQAVAKAQQAAQQAVKQAERAIDQLEQERQPQAKQSVTIKTQGTIVVVGPDGVKHTQTFGGEDGLGLDVQGLIEKSLEGAGAGLPEADRARLKRALQVQPLTVGPASAADTISGKLDRILERLEKLEQDVAALKSPQGSD